MFRIFSKKTSPSLKRELFGMNFSTPLALEPFPSEHPASKPHGGNLFAFSEIGPFTKGGAKVFAPKTSQQIVAANISNMDGRTTEELTKSIVASFSGLYDRADLFILDTFRPDKDGVIALQNVDALSEVMDAVLESRRFYDSDKPVLVRVSPSIAQSSLEGIIHYLRMSDADGIIAGYDSYCPELVRRIHNITQGRFPLLACGGINSPERADEMLAAGADMLQVSLFSANRILKHLKSKDK